MEFIHLHRLAPQANPLKTIGITMLLMAMVLPSYGVTRLSAECLLGIEIEFTAEDCEGSLAAISHQRPRRRGLRSQVTAEPWMASVASRDFLAFVSRSKPAFKGHRLTNGLLAPLRC